MQDVNMIRELLSGTDFKYKPDLGSEHPYIEMGRHNLAQLEKLGPDRQTRLIDIFFSAAADEIQPDVLQRFGHTDDSAVRAVLYEQWREEDEEWRSKEFVSKAKKELVDVGIDGTALEASLLFIDALPLIFAEFVVQGVSRWRLQPRSNASEIGDVLVEMFREGKRHGPE